MQRVHCRPAWRCAEDCPRATAWPVPSRHWALAACTRSRQWPGGTKARPREHRCLDARDGSVARGVSPTLGRNPPPPGLGLHRIGRVPWPADRRGPRQRRQATRLHRVQRGPATRRAAWPVLGTPGPISSWRPVAACSIRGTPIPGLSGRTPALLGASSRVGAYTTARVGHPGDTPPCGAPALRGCQWQPRGPSGPWAKPPHPQARQRPPVRATHADGRLLRFRAGQVAFPREHDCLSAWARLGPDRQWSLSVCLAGPSRTRGWSTAHPAPGPAHACRVACSGRRSRYRLHEDLRPPVLGMDWSPARPRCGGASGTLGSLRLAARRPTPCRGSPPRRPAPARGCIVLG